MLSFLLSSLQPLRMHTITAGGLEVRHERLTELRKSGQIAHYEVHNGQDVHLYWDGFAAVNTTNDSSASSSNSSKKRLSFDAVAAVPGSYTGRASSVYQYYTGEHKHWVAGLAVQVQPGQQ
jgi:alpha-2-macroglobulin-like protein